MASLSKFSYHRLKYEGGFDDEEEEERVFRNIRKWSSLRNFTFRKRAKLWIPVLRRFWKKRSRFFSRVKVSWRKALKRLKNGQAHMNDLFGGNFMFIQANPTLRCGQRPFMGHNIHGLQARYSEKLHEDYCLFANYVATCMTDPYIESLVN